MLGDRILIVDDNPTNAKLIRFILLKHGYTVEVAADAIEAMAHLGGPRPRLILMDLQLPGTDGFELTRRIKADPTLAGIPVVALTAFAMKGDEARARQAGCDGYITKPIDTAKFPAIVASFLTTPTSP